MKPEKKSAETLLADGLAYLGIPDTDCRLCSYLLQYIREIELFNAAFNLIKVKTTEELVVRHVLDSLAPWKIIAEKADSYGSGESCLIADIGSGAGLPGIPLACLFSVRNTPMQVTLIERMKKRCAVLENICAVLRLKNTAVLHTEVEKAPDNSFDIAVFRAFSALDAHILTTIQSKLRTDGMIAAYKGKKSQIEQELQAFGTAVPPHRIVQLTVPFYNAERNVVFFKKEV